MVSLTAAGTTVIITAASTVHHLYFIVSNSALIQWSMDQYSTVLTSGHQISLRKVKIISKKLFQFSSNSRRKCNNESNNKQTTVSQLLLAKICKNQQQQL